MSRLQAFHNNAAVFALASELSEDSAHVKKLINMDNTNKNIGELPNHSSQFHLLVQYEFTNKTAAGLILHTHTQVFYFLDRAFSTM
jgi:hypothetical protein